MVAKASCDLRSNVAASHVERLRWTEGCLVDTFIYTIHDLRIPYKMLVCYGQ